MLLFKKSERYVSKRLIFKSNEAEMKLGALKLAELQQELSGVVEDAKSGKLASKDAAERIIEIRTAMDSILNDLKSSR